MAHRTVWMINRKQDTEFPSDVRTPLGEGRVPAGRGWAGEEERLFQRPQA